MVDETGLGTRGAYGPAEAVDEDRPTPGHAWRRAVEARVVPLVPVVLGLAGAYAALLARGGAPSTVVHAFYFAILYSALRFGRAGGVVTAVVAGVLAGPLTPLAHGGGPQPFSDWGLRLAFFVGVALAVGWLARQDPRPLDVMLRDVSWSVRARGALRTGVVAPHYQPIVDLRTGEVVGVEALCRWPSGDGRFYPPADFIPAIERTGTIMRLDSYMLAATLAQAADWNRQGLYPLVTVNLSGAHFSDGAVVAGIAEAIEASGADPRGICLEITETAMIRNADRARAAVAAAHALGVQVALDDFGTGESPLSVARTFPVEILKIDHSFVVDVDRDPMSRALVAAVVALARALGARTVAEGIERPEQLAVLRELGCDWGQGWHLGRPVRAEAVPTLKARAV